MLACYALGIVAAVGTAWVFKRSLLKGPASSFILEMPTYKVPQVSQVARQVWVNTRAVPHQGRHDDLLPEHHPLGDGVLPAAA